MNETPPELPRSSIGGILRAPLHGAVSGLIAFERWQLERSLRSALADRLGLELAGRLSRIWGDYCQILVTLDVQLRLVSEQQPDKVCHLIEKQVLERYESAVNDSIQILRSASGWRAQLLYGESSLGAGAETRYRSLPFPSAPRDISKSEWFARWGEARPQAAQQALEHITSMEGAFSRLNAFVLAAQLHAHLSAFFGDSIAPGIEGAWYDAIQRMATSRTETARDLAACSSDVLDALRAHRKAIVATRECVTSRWGSDWSRAHFERQALRQFLDVSRTFAKPTIELPTLPVPMHRQTSNSNAPAMQAWLASHPVRAAEIESERSMLDAEDRAFAVLVLESLHEATLCRYATPTAAALIAPLWRQVHLARERLMELERTTDADGFRSGYLEAAATSGAAIRQTLRLLEAHFDAWGDEYKRSRAGRDEQRAAMSPFPQLPELNPRTDWWLTTWWTQNPDKVQAMLEAQHELRKQESGLWLAMSLIFPANTASDRRGSDR